MEKNEFMDRIYPNYWTVLLLAGGAILVVGSLCFSVSHYFIYEKISWNILLVLFYTSIFGYIAYAYSIAPLLRYYCFITITESGIELQYPLRFKRTIIQKKEIRSFELGTYYFHKIESPTIRISLDDKSEVELVRKFHKRFGELQFHLEEWGVRKKEPNTGKKLKSKF